MTVRLSDGRLCAKMGTYQKLVIHTNHEEKTTTWIAFGIEKCKRNRLGERFLRMNGVTAFAELWDTCAIFTTGINGESVRLDDEARKRLKEFESAPPPPESDSESSSSLESISEDDLL